MVKLLVGKTFIIACNKFLGILLPKQCFGSIFSKTVFCVYFFFQVYLFRVYLWGWRATDFDCERPEKDLRIQLLVEQKNSYQYKINSSSFLKN